MTVTWDFEDTEIDNTPFYLDSYPNIKHNFYHNGWYFVIYLTFHEYAPPLWHTDMRWAYSLNGIDYIEGGTIYHNYGSGNDFYTWWDEANNKIYLFRTDWDSGGQCIQIGTVGGNDITWGTKKNQTTTYRFLCGICKSGSRIYVLTARTSHPYNMYVDYSDNDGDTWNGEALVAADSDNGGNVSGICPLVIGGNSIYIVYQTETNHLHGKTYDGSSFGSEEDTNLTGGWAFANGPIRDGAGRIHYTTYDYADTELFHNWRSAGLSGTWQGSATLVKDGFVGAGYMVPQLIMNSASTSIRLFYTNDGEGDGVANLYYKEWNGSFGAEVHVGILEILNDRWYYNLSLRIPYSYDGNEYHIPYTWQCEKEEDSGYYVLMSGHLSLGIIGHYGGKIIIGATSVESFDVLDVSMEQSCDVALRDVPLKSLGEVMDTGTYMVHTLTLAFSMRLSDADKTTLETLFTSHAEATVYLEDEYGDYWTFTGWFRDKDIIYEYERTRPWKVNFIFDIYSYSYSGASIGTFTNSQLRLVGGTTLDFEDVIDFSVSEETSVAIPKWANQSPTIDTNIWNKKLKRVTYTVRETEYRLYKLLQMLTAHAAITFYDYIHGPTIKTAWLTSVRADWNPVKKENLGSFVNAPWEVEFEVIVQN
jgi:hypothetical protein